MNIATAAYYAKGPEGLSREEIARALEEAMAGRALERVLLLPPDFTRYNSNAGLITELLWHMLTDGGTEVDIMPAVGSHYPVTRREAGIMFGSVPYEKLLPHSWRDGVVKLGTVPASFLREVSEDLWEEPIDVEIDRRVLDPSYDLIVSIGQVVPHEVAGMANYSKNLFVGVGGSDMINKSHMLGAVFGIERVLGQDHTPVRALFDHALERFLKDRPILFVQTVCTAAAGKIHTHGLFIGPGRDTYEKAVRLSQEKNITYVPRGLTRCVTYLDPEEYRSTWVGNKAIYRTRRAMADGGELIILAPGVRTFGEDPEIDRLIRKYGYCGRLRVFEMLKDPKNSDLRAMQGTAAHLIHGSVDGRFRVIYAVEEDMLQAVRGAGFEAVDVREAMKIYDPGSLREGWNTRADGEEFYFIPNPGLGLWIDKSAYEG